VIPVARLPTGVPPQGIWIETLELTDVKVCSQRLFEDMQVEFRQNANLKSERIRLESSATISRERISTELKTAQAKADAAASQRSHGSSKPHASPEARRSAGIPMHPCSGWVCRP
jgi:hypothetical protein